ncbi:MAG TPA: hypothetical protein VE688_05140 [Gaiellaceae bacterium]|jgi:hypothetical protein|nr:hypothetical protein [Gaiellaceae bacterium]
MQTSTGPTTRDRTDRRRAKRHPFRNRIVVAVALLIAFGVGVALGQALHDNPRPGGEQTSFRTFPPLTATTSP